MTAIPSIASPSLERARRSIRIAMPDPTRSMPQDREWVLYHDGKAWREIRLHDYETIFAIPGLYEHVIEDILGCESPGIVSELLAGALRRAGVDPAGCEVLDLGAGNGCVAEELARRGFRRFVGLDLARNAGEAAERDRPGLYQDYITGDILDLPGPDRARLDRRVFDALVCVAALGFGDIPPGVFRAALERVRPGGWAAFTIKSDFLDEADQSGFSVLIRDLARRGGLKIVDRQEYRHRVSTAGEELRYTAIVGRKAG